MTMQSVDSIASKIFEESIRRRHFLETKRCRHDNMRQWKVTRKEKREKQKEDFRWFFFRFSFVDNRRMIRSMNVIAVTGCWLSSKHKKERKRSGIKERIDISLSSILFHFILIDDPIRFSLALNSPRNLFEDVISWLFVCLINKWCSI